MENDVNNASVVTESGVVEAAPTEQTDVSQVTTGTGEQQVAVETVAPAAAPAGQTEKEPVPYDRFAEVNTEKNDLKAQVEQLQAHVKLVGNQQPVQQTEQPAQEGLTMQVMKQLGVDPEYATPAEMAKVNDAVMQIMVNQVTNQNQNQQFISGHTDFEAVVGKTDQSTGQFIYAPPLARVLSEDPTLIATLKSAGAGANALAYRLAVTDKTYQAELTEAAKDPNIVAGEAAEVAIKAVTGLTSVSAVGTGGVIDKAAQMAGMSDAEHQAHTDAVKRNGGVAI